MVRNVRDGVPVTVTIAGFTGLRYGFLSRLDPALYGAFGQTQIYDTIVDITGIVFGANSPKPARAQKLLADGYEGSFCSSAQIPTLKANGYQVVRTRSTRRPINSSRSQTFYITINGVKYAWNKANAASEPANLITVTGITAAASDESGLVWGAQFPKPAKARFDVNGNSYSTFISPDEEANIPDEVVLDNSGAFYSLDQLRTTLPSP